MKVKSVLYRKENVERKAGEEEAREQVREKVRGVEEAAAKNSNRGLKYEKM